MAYQGINFRETAGYRTDNAGETYARGEVYPTTRAGQTFGCDASLIGNGRDRSLTYDVRIAGILFSQNNTVRNFRYDLPSTGVGTIRLGLGDSAGGSTHHIQLLDGGVVFATLAPTTVVGGNSTFADAVGNLWSEGAWPASNVAITHTFTSTNFTIRMGDGSSSGITCLTHVSVDMAASSPPAAAIAWTEGTEVFAANGTVTVSGIAIAAAWTEGAETFAAAGTVSAAMGTITTRIIKNNTGFARVNLANCAINIYNATTGALVLRLTGLTSNPTGRLVIANAALVSGTSYAYEIDLTAASMGRRLPLALAA